MDEQQHILWFDLNHSYNLDKFLDNMYIKIIWGCAQTLIVWTIENDYIAEWKLRTNEHF